MSYGEANAASNSTPEELRENFGMPWDLLPGQSRQTEYERALALLMQAHEVLFHNGNATLCLELSRIIARMKP